MDLSALIFVALAVAWAVYLIPKALKHHDDVVRGRSVDRFSHTMRVLARREPVNRRSARLVVAPGRARSAPEVTTKGAPSVTAQMAEAPLERPSTQMATQRRRRVLGLVLLANVAVVTVAAFSLISWGWTAAPAALLVAWLVACRLMVRKEQGVRVLPTRRSTVEEQVGVEDDEDLDAQRNSHGHTAPAYDEGDDLANTGAIPAIVDPSLWDPMPVTLPTYVTKPAATRRTVRTIDLDSTGVWTSGRSEVDSQIAREADEAARAQRNQSGKQGDEGHRAVGS